MSSLDQEYLVSEDRTDRQGEQLEALLTGFNVTDRATVEAELQALGLPSSREEIRELELGTHERIIEASITYTQGKLSEAIAAGVGAGGADEGVQDLTELTALDDTEREDKKMRLVEDEGWTYRFDAESTADPADDGVEIPDDLSHPADPGRWIKIEVTDASEVSTTGIRGTINVQDALEALDKKDLDGSLYLDPSLTETEVRDAINAMVTSMSSVIATKGYAKVELSGKISWSTQAIRPDPCHNIVFVKQEGFIFELPTGMETGSYTEPYFQGRGCSLTGGMGVVEVHGAASTTARLLWEGSQGGLCENWDYLSHTLDTNPAVHFDATGDHCTIRNIHRQFNIQDVTITSVTDVGGFARFYYSEGAFANDWFNDGSTITVDGTTNYDGTHNITAFSRTGKYFTTDATYVADETGTGRVRAIHQYGASFNIGAVGSFANIKTTGSNLVVSNIKGARYIRVDGADTQIYDIHGAQDISLLLNADRSSITSHHALEDSLEGLYPTTIVVEADETRLTALHGVGVLRVEGINCQVSNLDTNSSGDALDITGAFCQVSNYAQLGSTIPTTELLADDIFISNMRGKSVIALNGDRLKMVNCYGTSLATEGPCDDCRIEIDLKWEVNTTPPDFSGFTNSKLDVQWGIYGNVGRTTWEMPSGFGLGNKYKFRVFQHTPDTDDKRVVTILFDDPFTNAADGQTFELIWENNSEVYEIKKTAPHVVGAGNVEVNIVGAADNLAIADAIDAAVSNSIAPFVTQTKSALGISFESTRYLAMVPTDIDNSDDKVTHLDVTGATAWASIGARGQNRADVVLLHDAVDCDFDVTVSSLPGAASDENVNAVACILDTVVGGSVDLTVREFNADDEPRVICLSPTVQYKINNRLGSVYAGYELGSMGKMQFTGMGVGSSIDSLTVNGVEQLSASVLWNTDLDTTMDDLVAEINSNVAATDYRAERAPNEGVSFIKIFEVVATETNAYTLAATVTGGGAGTEVHKLKGGIDLGITKGLMNVVADKLHFSNSTNKTTKVAGTAVLGNASTGNTAGNSVTEVS